VTRPDYRLIPPPRTPPLKGEGGTATSTPPSPLRGGVRGGGELDRLARWLAACVIILLTLATPAYAVNAEAILAEKPPKLLSEFGFFADGPKQKPADGVMPYDLNTALFSDRAEKFRFVFVPAGQSSTYVADEAFEFPAGSALIKTFAFPADLSKSDENIRLIETRVMLRRESGWFAVAYVWNADQTDAELKIAGAKVAVETILDGHPLTINYAVPNRNQCKGCHDFNGEITPLGPKARNLNKTYAYADGEANQLARWTSAGILSGAPGPAAAPKVPDWHDAAAPIEARARAWLDVNCAHCHRREGPASNSGLFLNFTEQNPVALGVGKRPVAAGRGAGDRAFDIDPGNPDNSILLYRVESTEPGVMMPELGRTLADPAAVDLLRAWIARMR